MDGSRVLRNVDIRPQDYTMSQELKDGQKQDPPKRRYPPTRLHDVAGTEGWTEAGSSETSISAHKITRCRRNWRMDRSRFLRNIDIRPQDYTMSQELKDGQKQGPPKRRYPPHGVATQKTTVSKYRFNVYSVWNVERSLGFYLRSIHSEFKKFLATEQYGIQQL
jgi:hypothetical protein